MYLKYFKYLVINRGLQRNPQEFDLHLLGYHGNSKNNQNKVHKQKFHVVLSLMSKCTNIQLNVLSVLNGNKSTGRKMLENVRKWGEK